MAACEESLARYNEILVGRFNRALQKLTQLKGDAPAPQMASEIQPSWPLPLGNEFRYLEGWSLWSMSGRVTGGAAQFSAFRLRNPTGSNVIGVIQSVIVSAGQAAGDTFTFALGPIAGDLTTVLTPQRLDARLKTSGTGSVLIPSQTTNSGGAGSPQIGILGMNPANNSYETITDPVSEIPLLPGDTFQIDDATANQQLTFWVRWRERFLEESERT